MPDNTSEIKLVLTGESVSATKALEEIGKAATQFSEELAKSISRIGELGSVVAKFGEDLGMGKDAVAGMSGAMTRFGKNISKQAESVNKASADIVKSMSDIPKTADEVARVGTQSFQQLSSAEREAVLATNAVTDRIKAETDATRAQTEATKAATSSTRQYHHDMMLTVIAMQMIGTSIAATGMVGARLFVGAIKSAMDFQAMMDRVHAALNTTGGATVQQMNALGQVAQQLDQTSQFSMNDIADMMQALSKQGLNYQQIYSGAAQATVTLAQATDTSLTSTGTVITDMMHEFNLSGSQMTPVINGISGAMHQANISMTDFYNSAKYVGPLASQMGLSFNDLSQALGLLAQHGIKGSQSGTSLRRMLMDLQPSTKAATAEFKKLGLVTQNGSTLFFDASGKLKSMGDIVNILHTHLNGLNGAQKEAALRTMFGVYSLSAMEVIAGTTKQRWDALTKSMGNATAADVAAEKMNNLRGHLKEFTSTLQTIGTQLATFVLPFLDKMVQGLQRLAGAFKDLSPHTQHVIFIVFGVVSALAILTGTIITLAATMMFLQPGFALIAGAAGPISIVVGVVAALALAAFELWKHWDAVKKVVGDVKDKFNEAKDKMNEWKKDLIDFKDNVVKKFDDLLNTLKGDLEKHQIALKVTAGILGTIFGPALIATGVKAAISGAQIAANFIVNVIKVGTEAVISAAKVTGQFIVSMVKTGAQAIVTGAQLVASVIKQSIALGVQAVIAAGKLTGSMVVALVSYAAQGWVTAASVAGLTAKVIAQGIAWVAQKVAVVASTVASGALTAAQWALNAAMDANPIGLVIIALAGLGLAIYEVVKHFQQIVDWAERAWNAVKNFMGISAQASSQSAPAINTPGKIPRFATGGIVAQPTLALVGETEPEYIIPRSKLMDFNFLQQFSTPNMNPLPSGGRLNSNIGGRNVIFNGPITIVTQAKDGQGIGRSLKQQFSRALA